MKSQISLIDGVLSFSPTREKWVSKPAEDLPEKVTVYFKTGQTGSLDLKDPVSAHWAHMIDEQVQAKQPVYIEIDEESNVITNLLIPIIYKVKALETDERGDVIVSLMPSAAGHFLLKTDPDFEMMLAKLQTALDDDFEVLITETRDEHEIIDVRLPAVASGGPTGPSPAPPDDPPVSEARAQELYGDMNAESCNPCNPSSDCIPFKFPDDGCWIRAHIMCHMMDTDGEDPEKVWIDFGGVKYIPTSNHPNCRTPWGWHVAPTLKLDTSGSPKVVIDPSVSPFPESKTDWRNRQGHPSASLQDSPWIDYNWVGDTRTVDIAQAQQYMQHYRTLLKDRCLQLGPPPYSCIKNLFFIMDRNTISDDEVEAMLLSGSPAQISDAFYVVLDGYSPHQLGFTSATMQHQPNLDTSPGMSGMTLTADRISFEYPNHLNRPQRLTWVYNIDLTDISDFTANRRVITVQATMDTDTGSGTLYLIKQANPYEIDGSVSWLSTDLRVFSIKTGETRFGVTIGSDPNTFITQVITKLNNNTAVQTFDSISIDQQTSRLELSETVGGVAVYNFAVAKVRYRSTVSDAQDVRVFFRLFPWATTSVEYNQGTEYRRFQSGNQVVPLLGKKNNLVSSIPCFASPRINTALASMTTQTDTPNVQTITKDTSGALVSQYFGCWLDINQSQQTHFPDQFPATNIEGPYTSNRKSILDHIRNEHQCLVSEIAFLPEPAQNGTTPSNSDKLAQRNLAIVRTANPGMVFSRRIPQTFEIQPSSSTLEHDELMIDWGNVPTGSVATVYLQGINSREVLTLASNKYRHHRLKRIDEHTIKFETGGVSYLPIPFSDSSFPGLLTIDLPEGIKNGEKFTVVVRQVSGVGRQHDLRRVKREEIVDWRYIVGSFQLTIPVRDKAEILPPQQRLLSNLRWIERSIPEGNRWMAVFSKYVAQVADRVDALGGDSNKVAPSSSGQWQQAYRTCRIISIINALLIAALVVGSGTQTGGLVVLGGIPLIALLAGTVYLWRKKCRPTNCQLLRSLLVGSSIGAIILALLVVFGIFTSQLITTLIFSVGVATATIIVSWVKGCFS